MLEPISRPTELASAVQGLAGLCGATFMPMLLSWLRLALRWISARQSALARAPRFSGRLFGLCLTWTLLFGFFAVARSRAVSELQLVRVQSLTFASTLTAVLVGLLMWAVMAALWGLVRIDVRRGQVRRYER